MDHGPRPRRMAALAAAELGDWREISLPAWLWATDSHRIMGGRPRLAEERASDVYRARFSSLHRVLFVFRHAQRRKTALRHLEIGSARGLGPSHRRFRAAESRRQNLPRDRPSFVDGVSRSGHAEIEESRPATGRVFHGRHLAGGVCLGRLGVAAGSFLHCERAETISRRADPGQSLSTGRFMACRCSSMPACSITAKIFLTKHRSLASAHLAGIGRRQPR